MSMTSAQIVRLLASKHSNDVWVPECKNGPTQAATHARIDGWAMKKSWSGFEVIGYEVKVSRSDFLRDEKWRAYLPMCHALYFAAPKGIILADEVPAECGLIETTSGGQRLITRKKAPHRSVQISEGVWVYILMWRARIQRENATRQNADYWRQWLAERTDEKHLGHMVSRKVRETVNSAILEADGARAQLALVNEIVADLEAHGINVKHGTWQARKTLRDYLAGDAETLRDLRAARDAIDRLLGATVYGPARPDNLRDNP